MATTMRMTMNGQDNDGSASIYFDQNKQQQQQHDQLEDNVNGEGQVASLANDVSTVTLDHHLMHDMDDDVTMGLTVTPETSAGLRLSQRSDKQHNYHAGSDPENNNKRRSIRPRSFALQYQELDIFGREDEKKILQECIQRLHQKHQQVNNSKRASITSSKRTEICFISGVSGCGKSTMAKYLERIIHDSHPSEINNDEDHSYGGLYVEGKFAMNTKGEPLSGIKAACLQICGELLFLQRTHPDQFKKLLAHMMETLDAEIPILLHFIPDLQDVLSAASTAAAAATQLSNESSQNNKMGIDSDSSKIRLYIAFRRFLRFIAKHFSPFVMVLDDIQRADTASLEMMLSSVADAENSGFLLVCTHRCNDGSLDHPPHSDENSSALLQEFIHDSQLVVNDPASGLAKVTDIQLANLTVEEVQQMITILFHMNNNDEDKARRLAHCAHKRTMGNMFYLNRFLTLLRDDGLVQYNADTHTWEWDDNVLWESTAATGNVVDLMKVQLREMPPAIQQRLSLAALLGASFDAHTEAMVWEYVVKAMPELGNATANEWLTKSEESGILERLDEARYQWVHDKVQEAAIALLSYDDRPRYGYMVGRALLDKLPEEKVEPWLFTIVDLLNGHALSRQGFNRWESIRLNKHAAEKAFDQCAFASAHEYARSAIGILPSDAWKSDRNLTLDLYSLAAESAEALADLEHLQDYVNTVVRRLDLTIVDKSRILNAQLNCFYREETPGLIAKGFDLLLFIMAELNVTFPKRSVGKVFSSLSLFLKIKRKIKSLSKEDVLAMPPMTDPKKIMIMNSLGKNMPHVYLTNPDIVGLWILTFGSFTLEHGICHMSQTAFAQLGIVFLIFGDMDLAEKCATFATLLVDKSWEANKPSAAAGYQAYGMTLSYRKPYQVLMDPLYDLYKRDSGAGDLMSASSDMFCYLFMKFAAGCPLAEMEDLCRIHERRLNEWKNENSRLQAAMLWQTVLNLMGTRPKDHCLLEGHAINDYSAMKGSLSIIIQDVILKYLELFLCAIFGEYERAAELMADDEDDLFHKTGPGLSPVMHDAFVRGLCYFGLARKTGHAKYKRAGKKILATISNWVKKGNPNVLHYEKLFQAELAALNGRMSDADLYYHKAVGLATQSGFIQDAAIINERCGDFFQNIQRKSPGYAIHKIEEACRFYEEWGCSFKAQTLREQYKLNRTSIVSQATILVKT